MDLRSHSVEIPFAVLSFQDDLFVIFSARAEFDRNSSRVALDLRLTDDTALGKVLLELPCLVRRSLAVAADLFCIAVTRAVRHTHAR